MTADDDHVGEADGEACFALAEADDLQDFIDNVEPGCCWITESGDTFCKVHSGGGKEYVFQYINNEFRKIARQYY
jgi:hypothetical protein